ncbi:MAG: hypothetical protein NZ899_06510 [Thermoguttaceae bacterium]|nr:hypothetical protein [Thermoguttaceae bacterium]MDW8079186.1 hypothetical protein [Thermoguttaceae bacterium]
MWLIDFPPQGMQASGTNAALVNVREGWPVVVFPASEGLRADWAAVLPSAYRGEGLRVLLLAVFAGDSDPRHQAAFELVLDRLALPGGSLGQPASSPPQVAFLAVPAQEGVLSTAEASFPAGEASARLAAGELFRLRLRLVPELSQFAGQCQVLRVLVRPAS